MIINKYINKWINIQTVIINSHSVRLLLWAGMTVCIGPYCSKAEEALTEHTVVRSPYTD